MVDERNQRSEARKKAGMDGEIIDARAEPAALAAMTPKERFAQLNALCSRLWRFSGGSVAKPPRANYPGEVFKTTYGS